MGPSENPYDLAMYSGIVAIFIGIVLIPYFLKGIFIVILGLFFAVFGYIKRKNYKMDQLVSFYEQSGMDIKYRKGISIADTGYIIRPDAKNVGSMTGPDGPNGPDGLKFVTKEQASRIQNPNDSIHKIEDVEKLSELLDKKCMVNLEDGTILIISNIYNYSL